MTDTVFGPDVQMTRGMFVTVLGKIYTDNGFQISASGTHFSDVAPTAYYAPYVNWAYEAGIVSGVSDQSFSPNESVTREQLAQMMYKFAMMFRQDGTDYNKVTLSSYSDRSSISLWAFKAMCWAVDNGLINGTSAVTLSPKNIATRAQVAQLLYNLFN